MAIKTLRERAEIFNDLVELHDEMPVTIEEASIFIGIGEKTMARMRQNGTGPTYQQAETKEGTKARNQKVFYKMKHLRAWSKQQEHDSTMGVLLDRGVLTFNSMSDLLRPEPFFIRTVSISTKSGLNKRQGTMKMQQIIGHLQCVTKTVLNQSVADPDVQLENLSLDEAMKELWADPKAMKPFHKAYVAVLQSSIYQASSLLEAAELHAD